MTLPQKQRGGESIPRTRQGKRKNCAQPRRKHSGSNKRERESNANANNDRTGRDNGCTTARRMKGWSLRESFTRSALFGNKPSHHNPLAVVFVVRAAKKHIYHDCHNGAPWLGRMGERAGERPGSSWLFIEEVHKISELMFFVFG